MVPSAGARPEGEVFVFIIGSVSPVRSFTTLFAHPWVIVIHITRAERRVLSVPVVTEE